MRIPSVTASLVLISVVAVTLGACASAGGPPSRYSQEMDRLTSECTARDGILQPTGAVSGEPARDYACIIRGGGSRIN